MRIEDMSSCNYLNACASHVPTAAAEISFQRENAVGGREGRRHFARGSAGGGEGRRRMSSREGVEGRKKEALCSPWLAIKHKASSFSPVSSSSVQDRP